MPRIAVFGGASLELPATSTATFVAVPVAAADAEAAVEAAVGSGDFDAFVNLCQLPVAARVAAALEPLLVPCGGCAADVLRYTRGDLHMIAFYADLAVPPHRVLSSAALTAAPFDGLEPPLQLRGAAPERSAAAPVAAGDTAAVAAFLRAAPRCVLEAAPAPAAAFRVLAASGGAAPRTLVVGGAPSEQQRADAAKLAVAMAGATLRGRGFLAVEVHAVEAGGGQAGAASKLVVVDSVPQADPAPWFEGQPGALAEWAAALLRDPELPTFCVAFDPSAKGYHVVAARALSKGSTVFEDEQHPFPIVTKPHVDKHWSDAERDVFKRYAWPLDSDGHVYAVWEDNPRTWRPINHSCDPNCIFAEGHSLNVIAARDITTGDALTMDYATFCDFTMQPFTCFCKADSCRTTIVPDEASLAKYGTNAWHRRMRTT